jgi:hypothetical protein
MYTEFRIVIWLYLTSLRKSEVIFEILFPLAIGGGVSYLVIKNPDILDYSGYLSTAISFLGVLLGFSMAVITILITGSGKTFEAIKAYAIETKKDGSKTSLFRLLFINLAYSIILEAFLLMTLLIQPFISVFLGSKSVWNYLGFGIVIVLIIHVLLLTIRNITNLYLALSKR